MTNSIAGPARIAIVIPAYKSRDLIGQVLNAIPSYVNKVLVVDDACPDKTGEYVKQNFREKRFEVVFNEQNLGVGGATVNGLKRFQNSDFDLVVKIDSDGQMDPTDIPKLLEPLISNDADYSKGNRFNSLDDLQEMPKSRIFGNAILSLMSKFSTGYWTITDPTNGFFAIKVGVLNRINLDKLRKRWFFESDLLFRLSIIRAVVSDVPLRARYGNEKSNLKIRKVIWEFVSRHSINFLKRIFYVYYLREWSVLSLELPTGMVLTLWGLVSGVLGWINSSATGSPATIGQVMLSVVPLILGFQLLIGCVTTDVNNEPKKVLVKL